MNGRGHLKGFAAMLVIFWIAGFVQSDDRSAVREVESEAARELRSKGAVVHLGLKTKRIAGVSANGLKEFGDDDLGAVALFSELTDLSLEATRVGDAGLEKIKDLEKIEWLNLYRSQVSNAGLVHLSGFFRLEQLPIGETRVTDAGLKHLIGLKKLRYLGLRGNWITDAGVGTLAAMTWLKSLHLGSTQVTDAAVDSLLAFTKLEELWLHDTALTDAGLGRLAEMKPLRKLHIQRTHTTVAAVKALRLALPDCEVFWESDQ